MSAPCRMRLWFVHADCGQPATLGFQSSADDGVLIPMCDDCIRDTRTDRRRLVALPTEGAEATA
jgi:hypothetical protein